MIEINMRKHLDFLTKFTRLDNGCWEWKLSRSTGGYGQMTARFEGKSSTTAHRVAYWLFKGFVPNDMEVHHTCFNPWCVNPDHLELVTPQENKYLKSGKKDPNKCPQGHDYDYVDPSGGKRCTICRKAAKARYAAKRKAAEG